MIVLPRFILLAAIAARRLEIAELPDRLPPRLVPRHPGPNKLVDAHLEVEIQLFIDFRLHGCGGADTRMAFAGSRFPPPGSRHDSWLGSLQHRIDRTRVAAPVRGLLAQARAAGRGQRVKAGAAVVLGWSPLGIDEVLPMQPMQGLIECRVFDG